jgi:hypothetical protein
MTDEPRSRPGKELVKCTMNGGNESGFGVKYILSSALFK